jgi:hypothetical protein
VHSVGLITLNQTKYGTNSNSYFRDKAALLISRSRREDGERNFGNVEERCYGQSEVIVPTFLYGNRR